MTKQNTFSDKFLLTEKYSSSYKGNEHQDKIGSFLSLLKELQISSLE